MHPDFPIGEYIMHHVTNSSEWKLPFLPAIHFPPWFSLHAMMLVVASIFLVWLFVFVYDRNTRVPTGITNALEAFVVFIRDDIAIEFMGEEDGRKFTPLLCTFFFFILCLNLMGLIPAFATATGNINVPGALALVTFAIIVFGTMLRNGVKEFFTAFLPRGIFLPLALFIGLMEFFSLFIKMGALMLRLFANMLAGHIVIISLLALIVLFGYFALPSLIMALFIFVLETFVAFLQAYIFTLLSALFIGQMYHPQH